MPFVGQPCPQNNLSSPTLDSKVSFKADQSQLP